MSKDIAIFVVADNISKDTINRFKDCIDRSRPKRSVDVYILNNSRENGENFNKSKLLNKGISRLISKEYDVLIQTDIDLIIPPDIIDYSYDEAMKGKICFHNDMIKLDPKKYPELFRLPRGYELLNWNKYKTSTFIFASGCWNAMQLKYWYSTGGYNEYMVEWGREDDDWRNRSRKFSNIQFNDSKKFSLIHVNHPPRTKDLRWKNDKMANKEEKEGRRNWL